MMSNIIFFSFFREATYLYAYISFHILVHHSNTIMYVSLPTLHYLLPYLVLHYACERITISVIFGFIFPGVLLTIERA